LNSAGQRQVRGAVDVPPDADIQTKLLAMLGRDRRVARRQAQSSQEGPVFAGISDPAEA